MSGINGSDQTPIQQEFEANLQAQLDSIKQIQEQQTNLYSKLEVLGASNNISDQSVSLSDFDVHVMDEPKLELLPDLLIDDIEVLY